MIFPQIRIQQKIVACILLGLSLIVSYKLVQNPHYLLVLSGFLLLVFFVLRFDIVFPALLIARSGLDIYTDVGFYLGPMNLNVPAAISLFIDLVGSMYLLLVVNREKRPLLDDTSKAFLVWLLSLIFWVLLAYWNFGFEGLLSVREWIRLFSLFIIYLLSRQLTRIKGYEYLLNAAMLSLIAPIAVAYYQIVFNTGSMATPIHRVYGTLAHPNAFSLYLIPFMAIIGWKLKFAKRRLPWFTLELVLLVALVNAFSLGGIVMAGIFFVIFILKELEFKLKLVVFTMLLFLLVAFSQTENGQRRIQELKASPSLHEVVKSEISTNSFTWRMVNWKVLLEQWQKSPVLGYGLNTAEIVNPWHGVSPHNDYLRFLVECGIVGFLMTGGFFIVTWKRLARIIATETNPKKHYLAFLMQTVFVSWMVGAAVDNYITTTTFQFYFWALLAAVMVNPQDGSELTPKESPLPLDPCDSGS